MMYSLSQPTDVASQDCALISVSKGSSSDLESELHISFVEETKVKGIFPSVKRYSQELHISNLLHFANM